MDPASAIQQAMLQQAVWYLVLVWLVAAICTGLWASEIKRRGFWVWVTLSLLTGPIAWFLIIFRLDEAIPPELRVTCPKCARISRKGTRRCPRCNEWLDPASRDRAADLGRQAATMVFTARRLFGNARRVADQAAKRRGEPG